VNARRIIIIVLAVIVVVLGAYQLVEGQRSVKKQLKAIIEVLTSIDKTLESIGASQKSMVNLARNVPSARRSPTAAQRRPQPDLNKVYKIDIGDSPIRGKKDAKITIVEYSEVQCPYSQRFHPIVLEVFKAFPKDVKLVFKHFPLGFHNNAKPAAKAILAAGEQGKYWEMLDLLFENGKNLSDEKYSEFAKQLGLNVSKFNKDLKEKDSKWEEIIKKDMDLARKVNVRGTPTFFINGKLTRSRDLGSFKAEIDAILKK